MVISLSLINIAYFRLSKCRYTEYIIKQGLLQIERNEQRSGDYPCVILKNIEISTCGPFYYLYTSKKLHKVGLFYRKTGEYFNDMLEYSISSIIILIISKNRNLHPGWNTNIQCGRQLICSFYHCLVSCPLKFLKHFYVIFYVTQEIK